MSLSHWASHSHVKGHVEETFEYKTENQGSRKSAPVVASQPPGNLEPPIPTIITKHTSSLRKQARGSLEVRQTNATLFVPRKLILKEGAELRQSELILGKRRHIRPTQESAEREPTGNTQIDSNAAAHCLTQALAKGRRTLETTDVLIGNSARGHTTCG